MVKNIKNIDIVAYKLLLTFTKIPNYKLKIAKKEQYNKKKKVKK